MTLNAICLSMLKMTLGPAGCLLVLKMTLDAGGCHGCLFMHLAIPLRIWLHLYVPGCTLMYLVAVWCTCFQLGGNLGPWCSWMVFDANLLVYLENNYPFLTAWNPWNPQIWNIWEKIVWTYFATTSWKAKWQYSCFLHYIDHLTSIMWWQKLCRYRSCIIMS